MFLLHRLLLVSPQPYRPFLLSHNAPEVFFQFPHPDWILWFYFWIKRPIWGYIWPQVLKTIGSFKYLLSKCYISKFLLSIKNHVLCRYPADFEPISSNATLLSSFCCTLFLVVFISTMSSANNMSPGAGAMIPCPIHYAQEKGRKREKNKQEGQVVFTRTKTMSCR